MSDEIRTKIFENELCYVDRVKDGDDVTYSWGGQLSHIIVGLSRELEKWKAEALQQYPTPEAYDAVCKARESTKSKLDKAMEALQKIMTGRVEGDVDNEEANEITLLIMRDIATKAINSPDGKSLSESQVISIQATDIMEMQHTLGEYEDMVNKIHRLLYSIGSPLNDNIEKYTDKQLGNFFEIGELIKGFENFED